MVMISHGISTGALFFLIGMLYERRHTRLIAAYGGIARVVPMFSLVLTVVALSSIGLPGLNGFVGEFLVLLGSFARLPLGDRHRHHGGDLRRGVPALGAAADDLQPARQAGERGPDRPDAARAGRAAAAGRGHRLAGPLSRPGAAADGAGHAGATSELVRPERPPTTRAARSRPRCAEEAADEPAGHDHAAGESPSALLPEVLLSGWALVVLLVVSWRHGRPRTAAWPGGSALPVCC